MSYDLVARKYLKSFIESLWKTDTFNQGEKKHHRTEMWLTLTKKPLKM